ncbi:MAG: hypothetical protein JRC92_02290 [Deltaproteobacteria bacterium]|nr:hypothetical protein [Deltaproteobacteria bacterium]
MIKRLSWILVLILLLASPALAGQLVINVSAEATAKKDRVLVKLVVSNRGDEAAINIQAEPLMPSGETSGLVEILDAGGQVEMSLSLEAAGEQPGRHLAVIRVRFQDLNEYPFSALAHTYYHRLTDQPSPILLKTDQPGPFKLAGLGKLKIVLANPEPEPASVILRVFTPLEMSAHPEERKLKLPGRGEMTAVIRLSNFSGLRGAGYPVLISAEQMAADRHTVKVLAVMVSLVGRPNFFNRTLKYWLAAIGVLVALLIWSQVRRRRRS